MGMLFGMLSSIVAAWAFYCLRPDSCGPAYELLAALTCAGIFACGMFFDLFRLDCAERKAERACEDALKKKYKR